MYLLWFSFSSHLQFSCTSFCYFLLQLFVVPPTYFEPLLLLFLLQSFLSNLLFLHTSILFLHFPLYAHCVFSFFFALYISSIRNASSSIQTLFTSFAEQLLNFDKKLYGTSHKLYLSNPEVSFLSQRFSKGIHFFRFFCFLFSIFSFSQLYRSFSLTISSTLFSVFLCVTIFLYSFGYLSVSISFSLCLAHADFLRHLIILFSLNMPFSSPEPRPN